MAASGRLLASVFTHLDGMALEGMTTLEIDARVETFIVDVLKARPASKGQYGYGFVLNSSINQVVCHGVPSADDVLKSGDIVNLDITLEKNGFIADSSKTYMVGIRFASGCEAPRAGRARRRCGRVFATGPARRAHLGDIGFAIERHAKTGTAMRWCATIAGTASAARCTRSRRSCISAGRERASCCAKA